MMATALTKRGERLLAYFRADAADSMTCPEPPTGMAYLLAEAELERGGFIERHDGEWYLTPKAARP